MPLLQPQVTWPLQCLAQLHTLLAARQSLLVSSRLWVYTRVSALEVLLVGKAAVCLCITSTSVLVQAGLGSICLLWP